MRVSLPFNCIFWLNRVSIFELVAFFAQKLAPFSLPPQLHELLPRSPPNRFFAAYAGLCGLAGWIGHLHEAIDPFVFEMQVQPLFGDDLIAGRWLETGTYRGGCPRARAETGTKVQFAGADFLGIEDGEVAEYWLSSDQFDLMTQLGMVG